jgi:hypothetical protein
LQRIAARTHEPTRAERFELSFEHGVVIVHLQAQARGACVHRFQVARATERGDPSARAFRRLCHPFPASHGGGLIYVAARRFEDESSDVY